MGRTARCEVRSYRAVSETFGVAASTLDSGLAGIANIRLAPHVQPSQAGQRVPGAVGKPVRLARPPSCRAGPRFAHSEWLERRSVGNPLLREEQSSQTSSWRRI